MSRLGFILTFFAACFCIFHAEAQIRIVPRENLEAMANPRHSSDSAWLQFDTRHIRVEMNEDDKPADFLFRMKNVGDKPIRFRRMVSTCSCASARYDRQTVMPGDSALITVSYDPKGHPGLFERKVFVYTGEGNSPAAILRMSVKVSSAEGSDYPCQMGGLKLRRSEVIFDKDVKAVERIPFINLSGRGIRLECIREMLPDCLAFSVEPSFVRDREEGEIVITFDPAAKGVREVMPLILKGTGVPPSQSSIIVKIK